MSAFDLFCTTAEGTQWVATFLDIDVAKPNVELLAVHVPGEYFIVDQISGDKLLELLARDSGIHASRLRTAGKGKNAQA